MHKLWWRGFFFLLMMLASWKPSHAQFSLPKIKNPVTMDVASPFVLGATKKPTLLVKNGRWFPVAVTLSNSGDEVKGRVTLRLTDSSGQGTRSAVFYSDVTLPAKASRKRVWLYGRVDGENAFNGADVTFEGGIKSIRTHLDLLMPELGERFVLTLSDSGERLGFLGGMNDELMANPQELAVAKKALNGMSGATKRGRINALGGSRDLIPDRWVGLEAADAVMLSDISHTAMTPEQIAALRSYTASGGLLVIRGGADWQRLSASPLNALWPLMPSSASAASTQETARLVNTYLPNGARDGADRLGGAPVLLMRGTLAPDARSLAANGLVAVRDFGAGRVLALAFDPMQPPFVGWRGQQLLWRAVFAQVPQLRRLENVDRFADYANYNYNYYGSQQVAATDVTGGLLRHIRKLPQLQTPPASIIAWFLALYVVVLVPVNYFILRRLDKRELAWITVPLIAIAFSFMSYVAARKIKGSDLLVRRVNVVQGSAVASTRRDTMTRSDALLWLFSPSKTTYTVTSGDAQMAVSDYLPTVRRWEQNEDKGSIAVAQPDANQPVRLENNDVKMWSQATFVGETVTPAGGGVLIERNGDALKVTNAMPNALEGAVLCANGKAVALGTLSANAVKVVPASEMAQSAASQTPLARKKTSSITYNAANSTASDIAQSATLPKIFDGETTIASTSGTETIPLSQVAREVLSVSLSGTDGREVPVVVGWAAKPASALELQNTAARTQDITLFVFRAPWLKVK